MPIQTCMRFFLLLNIEENYLKNAGNQTVNGFHCLPFLSLLWKSMGGGLRISSFVFNIRKKLIQVCNDMTMMSK